MTVNATTPEDMSTSLEHTNPSAGATWQSEQERLEWFTELGIYELAPRFMLAHVVPIDPETRTGEEQIVLVSGSPAALDGLLTQPWEILSLWIYAVGDGSPRTLGVDRVRRIETRPTNSSNSAEVLTLQCESGRTYCVDEEGMQPLRCPAVRWTDRRSTANAPPASQDARP